MPDVTIGDAARLSGVKVQTIRFYEERGLLPTPPRSEGRQRLFDGSAVSRLRFIRHARDLGFPLPAVIDLLALSDDPTRPCDRADAIATDQLAAVRRRIASLRSLEAELVRMSACAGSTVTGCRVIESLADHALCGTDHERAPSLN